MHCCFVLAAAVRLRWRNRRPPSRKRRSRRPACCAPRSSRFRSWRSRMPAAALKGVAPELAEAMARVLGVPYQPVAFDSPNAGIKALRDGAADVTFLAPTPERRPDRFRPGLHGDGGDADRAGRFADRAMLMPTSRAAGSSPMSAPPTTRCCRSGWTRATIVRVPLFGWKQAFELVKSGQADAYADLRDPLLRISRSCRARASCRELGATRSRSDMPRIGP